MIKIEKKHECDSFFRKDDIFDSKRNKEFKVSIFGWVIFKRIEHSAVNFEKNQDNGGVGFNKTK